MKLPASRQSNRKRVSAPLCAAAFGALLSAVGIVATRSGEPVASDEYERVIAAGFRQRSSEMPEEVATSYRELFKRSDQQTMADLGSNESASLALKAAWRLTELKCSERPDSTQLARFLGFVEGRIRIKVPAWWEGCILASRFDSDDRSRLVPGDSSDVDERLLVLRTVELGDDRFTVPARAGLAYDGGAVLWTQHGQTRRLPRELIYMRGPSSHEWATLEAAHERIYFAVGSDFDGSFGLACLTLDGQELWRATGWGNGRFRGAASGPWWAACELVLGVDQVAIFGQAFSGLFIEGFDRDSGDPLYRFCTRYMEEREQGDD